jgi:hypothetical protein
LLFFLSCHFPQTTLLEDEEAGQASREGEVQGEGGGGEDDMPVNYENLIPAPVLDTPASISPPTSSLSARRKPTGRVVGVIKR